MFWGSKAKLKFSDHLRKFGEQVYVTNRNKIKGKLEAKAWRGFLVGYTKDHSGDCYRIWNPDTKRVILSRDVLFSGRMYYQKEENLNEDDNEEHDY